MALTKLNTNQLDTDTNAGIAKAWVNFTGVGTVTIRDSFNVSSVTDNGTGDYNINLTNAMPSTDYCMTTAGYEANNLVGSIGATGSTVSSARIRYRRGGDLVSEDPAIAAVAILSN